MSGILNDKERIMDVLITENGRRQISDGTFKIEFASFSDHGVFYRDDGTGVADDAGSRLMFEAYSSATDVVIPEINALGKISMDISSGKRIVNGKIVSTGSEMREASFRSGSQDMFSGSQEIIQDAIDSFDRLQIIGTKNNWAIEEYFSVDKTSAIFTRPNDGSSTPQKLVKNVDHDLKPIFTDPSVSSLPAFKYLPPCYDGGDFKVPLAPYRKLNEDLQYSYEKVINDLNSEKCAPYGSHERTGPPQKETFTLDSDDPYLNILAQVFEVNDDSVNKLAVIDYGTYKSEDGADLGSIYHVGKIFRDSNNVPKFVKIMTLVFE